MDTQGMESSGTKPQQALSSNPIPSFDTMIPIEGIVVDPMRSKHGRGRIKYKWKRSGNDANGNKNEIEEKTVEYDYDQKANWQRSIFLTEGDRVRLFFRSIDDDDAALAYVALLDPVFKQRRYGECYYYHPMKEYFLRNDYGPEFIELSSYHIVDKKVQSYNLKDELIVFDFAERPNYNNSNKIATRCRWVELEDDKWIKGKIETVPLQIFDFGDIKYGNTRIRYSQSSMDAKYRNVAKVGDDVHFHIEHVITKSSYDVIPPTAINVHIAESNQREDDWRAKKTKVTNPNASKVNKPKPNKLRYVRKKLQPAAQQNDNKNDASKDENNDKQ